MPADMMEKTSSSPVAATPASMNTTPDKPKTASEHRKVGIDNIYPLLSFKTKQKPSTFHFGHNFSHASSPKGGFFGFLRTKQDKWFLTAFIILCSFSRQSQLWKREEEPESTRAWGS